MTDTILRGVVGSTAYGLSTPESDVDRLGVHVASVTDLLTWGHSPSQKSVVTTDPDSTSHDVGKYLSLAMKGNPTVLELLWLPEYEVCTWEGKRLLDIRRHLLSRTGIVNAYGGYAMQQIRRLLNRGDSFSADTRNRTAKHARHCFRLLIQGEHLLRTGELMILLPHDHLSTLWEISDRADRSDHEYLYNLFQYYDGRLQRAYGSSNIPDSPDVETVTEALLEIRMAALGTEQT